jgi:hypothetical protein
VVHVNCFFFSEQLEQEFPFWKHLHGFWRTLPNFNPYTASSEPGQDLVANVLALIQGRGQDDDNDYQDNDEDDTFGADDAQNGMDNDKGAGTTKLGDEQVCRQSHPLHQLQ